MYTNTAPRSHQMAAELIEAGRRRACGLPPALRGASVRPPAAARARAQRRAALRRRRREATYLTRADFEETGAVETDSEGIVDHLRAVDGTKVAVLVRDLLADDRSGVRKVSLRSTDGTVDVSRIARGLGGGGHRQAAGATSELPGLDELLAHDPSRHLKSSSERGHPLREARGRHLARRRRARCAGAPEEDKVGHAGTLDPFATGLLLVLVGRATRAQQFLMALPKTYRAVARLGWASTTGDPEGELSQTGRIPDDPQIPTGELMQRPHAFSAVKVGGEARLRAWPAGRGGRPRRARPSPSTAPSGCSRDGERAEFEIECSAGTYVRQLVAGLGDAYCEELERTAIGPFRLEDADPERVVAAARGARVPARAPARRGRGRGRRARPSRRRRRSTAPTRLTA